MNSTGATRHPIPVAFAALDSLTSMSLNAATSIRTHPIATLAPAARNGLITNATSPHPGSAGSMIRVSFTRYAPSTPSATAPSATTTQPTRRSPCSVMAVAPLPSKEAADDKSNRDCRGHPGQHKRPVHDLRCPCAKEPQAGSLLEPSPDREKAHETDHIADHGPRHRNHGKCQKAGRGDANHDAADDCGDGWGDPSQKASELGGARILQDRARFGPAHTRRTLGS